MTSSVPGPRSSKAHPKASHALRKGHGHCLVVCCQSNSLQRSDSWQTMTSETCAQQIDERNWKLQCPQPALVNRKGSVLLHDNPQPHTAQPALQKLSELGYRLLPQPQYSPGLSPTDCHVFKHLTPFSGKRLP